MNWEAIGAVGEVVGAAGVIISLLYLAVQIRGDARAKRAATTHDLSVATADALLAIADNSGLAEVYFRGIHDHSSLNGAELPRFSALLGHLCRMWEDQFFQWSEGHLDPRVWRGLEAAIGDFFSFPGVRDWWKTRSHWYSEQFQALIERKLSEQRAPTMYGEPAAQGDAADRP
jgi:hypothetical protein